MASIRTDSIIALDQGTHASRAALWDLRGQLMYAAHRPVKLHRREDGRVEQDAEELLTSLRDALAEVRAWAEAHDNPIRAAGLATQRSTVVAWDRSTGNPLAPAVSWQDTRGADVTAALLDHETEIRNRSGLRLSPHYGASKIAWLLNHEPKVQDAYEADSLVVGPLVSFLLRHLLEEAPCLTDEVNAGRTQLWNLNSRDWDPTLCDWFGIPPAVLPEGRPVESLYGHLAGSAIPVRAVNGDQNSAYFGWGMPPASMAVVNVGTGAFALTNLGPADPAADPALLTSVARGGSTGCTYLLEGTVNGAGAALDWFAATEKSRAEQPALHPWPACADPPIFLNSIGGLGSPWWSQAVAPVFIPDAAGATCRLAAVAESIVFLLQANLDRLQEVGGTLGSLRISGGLAQADGICQQLANLSGLPVERPEEVEATARGIAWLAAGGPADWAEAAATRFQPQADASLQRRYTQFMTELSQRLAR